ncbi:MAG: DUF1501 domain-containing protein [Pseudomonadota bacterium]
MSNGMLSRRAVLGHLGALGCSTAAFPAMTQMTFASVPTDNRLVVIILRGGMDGLDVVRPLGDPNFSTLRPDLDASVHDLDGFFALHDGLAPLLPLWDAGELAFAHAVSTPYRDKRSHFDGQDMLEAGTGTAEPDTALRDGWLNRLLETIPHAHSQTAFAIGRENLRILSGDAPVANWYPGTRLRLGSAAQDLLADLYAADPLFRDAAAESLHLSDVTGPDDTARGVRPEVAMAKFAADRLRQDTRIASFSLSGWDTHRNQSRMMPRVLGRLAETIQTLKEQLGPDWARTTVLGITEFGRTVRTNGSGGTDHGTGGTMILAGGAVRGGKVYTDWPGLSEDALYERRDLMPTTDTRAYAGSAIRGLFGTDRADLEHLVFPGSDLSTAPSVIL